MNQPPESQYDIFIAYPDSCIDHAIELFQLFSETHKVFLDQYSLKVGDNWADEIPNAQAQSLATMVLIDGAKLPHYAQDEVAAGIAFELAWGRSRHRVIPIYIGNIPADPLMIPYGLRCRQGYVLKGLTYHQASEI